MAELRAAILAGRIDQVAREFGTTNDAE